MSKYRITIDETDLSNRIRQVPKLLRPVLPDNNTGNLGCKRISSSEQGYSIIARDKETTSDYLGWRFATFHKEYRALYFETWFPVDPQNHKKWYLDRAYLSI